MDYRTYDFEALAKREAYPLLLTAIVPRPIGWLSTLSATGVRNLAPFSWFNAICAEPYLVAASV
jgi:flavin reductase (DIM6/NTAB) family NADH-FMN oxidoreductase RutF